jgi:hypothetical protein
MSFKTDYPEYAVIEHHIRRAHAERAVYIASLLANALTRFVGLFTRAPSATAIERNAIEADAFVKRWVPKY